MTAIVFHLPWLASIVCSSRNTNPKTSLKPSFWSLWKTREDLDWVNNKRQAIRHSPEHNSAHNPAHPVDYETLRHGRMDLFCVTTYWSVITYLTLWSHFYPWRFWLFILFTFSSWFFLNRRVFYKSSVEVIVNVWWCHRFTVTWTWKSRAIAKGAPTVPTTME